MIQSYTDCGPLLTVTTREIMMKRIAMAVSGTASRCGACLVLKVLAAAAMALATVWVTKFAWCLALEAGAGWVMLVIISEVAYLIASFVIPFGVLGQAGWGLEELTRDAPFLTWKALTLDHDITAWKMLLWPILMPIEALACVWLGLGWLGAALNHKLN